MAHAAAGCDGLVRCRPHGGGSVTCLSDLDPERQRLEDDRGNDPARREAGTSDWRPATWYLWGTYLSERQWGTVREDYSAHGTPWASFSHDDARSRVYRWGEDGLLGVCDDQMRLCFALALWNERDPILKERLFGLTGTEGNHGEDVKEVYYYLDGTPTHSYMRALYRYPHAAFPYAELVSENGRRDRTEPEYELLDAGVFAQKCYFDVHAEYAKAARTDLIIRISVTNCGSQAAPIHLLPTLWFRNTWTCGHSPQRKEHRLEESDLVRAWHPTLGQYWLAFQPAVELLFTENESNAERLWGAPNRTPYVKDAFHEYIVNGRKATVNPAAVGTKMAVHYHWMLPPRGTQLVYLRLSANRPEEPFSTARAVLERRRSEADIFYASGFGAERLSEDERRVQRQAFAGLLWTKQVYIWDVDLWHTGDPATASPPPDRKLRNAAWWHFNTTHVLSMPDSWEYPWFATWDLAFHTIPLALLDPELAKDQLSIMLREWYMHPNGQLPAYEWAFDDVNPPVHAWAALRVYHVERRMHGRADRAFLEEVFHKLLLNFTWWVNRKDPNGRNVFEGGFLGLDNVGVFDRSAELPGGGHLQQSDGTAWMGMYCLNMMVIALDLARDNGVYEDVANKFFQHFLFIASAMNNIGGKGFALWDEQDEFYYDVLLLPDSETRRLRVRSLVGLIPLLAVETITPDLLEHLPTFRARLEWFLSNRPALASQVSRWLEPGVGEQRLLALVRGHRMKALLRRMLDPDEFLGDYGIRSLSKYHARHPFVLEMAGRQFSVSYDPAESTTGLFGGNSNWRGPIWFPLNYMLIEALRNFHRYYGDDFLVECPTGSNTFLTLDQIADELARRLVALFLRNAEGCRPVLGSSPMQQTDPQWCDYVPFYEFFHGDTGAGLGASHQTGWTALVATLLKEQSRRRAA